VKLFGSRTSPYVRKVRVYLEETGLPYEFIEGDTRQPSPHLLSTAPLGKVPVLEREDGSALFESILIIEYFDCLRPADARLLAKDGEERWTTLRWHALAHGIIDATTTRLQELRRPQIVQMPEKRQWEESRIARTLTAIEGDLGSGDYLVGDRLTIADLALGVALQYVDFRYPHDWRSGKPRLTEWSAEIHRRQSFTKTLPPGFTPPLS
jgi:glutathione S-transferase